MVKNIINKKIRVHFDPQGVDVTVEKGVNLLEVAIAAGIHINASCGGAGVCGTCKVLIKKGEVDSARIEKLTAKEYAQGYRQACQSKIITDLTVEIPVESRLEKAVLSDEGQRTSEVLAAGWKYKPPLDKLFVELSPPTLKDNTSDLSRLLRGLRQQYKLSNISVDFPVLKKLSRVLRDGKWNATVTTLSTATNPNAKSKRRQRLINIEPGDTSKYYYSLAFDIGTTTIRGQLLNLSRGKVLAEKIAYNAQISYGVDVITRIAACQKPGGLKTLQKAAVDTINQMISDLVAKSRVNIKYIGHVSVAGNTTMTQILLGLDPKYLRLSPYTPTANFFPPVEAKSLGIKLGSQVYLSAFPAVASYVGGDIVAGIIGSGIYQRKALTLYIDIGTNGEIVVGNSDWMVTASCSAGPTFEGGGVKHGIVATEGAIESCEISPADFDPVVNTIGNTKPSGICGSGLIHIVASLLETGIISPNGKFHNDLSTKRVRHGADGYEYVLSWALETQTHQDIVITEVDIDNLIRSKAAMYAGCRTLLKNVGLDYQDLDRVIIAGAFGNHINIEKSITIGLLPDLARDKFIFIGNGSLLGARLASFSIDLIDDTRRIASMMTNFELSEESAFTDNYTAALFLPHTNSGEFPSAHKVMTN
ncbi:ASKHA domain-containing protein [Chloroflexota bacterium]